VSELWVEEIRRLKRLAFAYVPATASKHLVADLDRTMTVEKALVTGWKTSRGLESDDELRDFTEALARSERGSPFPTISLLQLSD